MIAGKVEVVWPGIRRIIAPNPGPMTGPGTNSYLVGEGDVVLVDPGPAIPGHGAALLGALDRGERIAAIVVTHAHLDHSALAPALAQATGAAIHAYGAAGEGLSPRMAALVAGMPQTGDDGPAPGREGIDTAFRPDQRLAEGDRLPAGGGVLGILHTPGHMAGHLSLAWEGALLTGDHVMGWSTSLVSPPEGDMTDYVAQLHRLAQGTWDIALPGHGGPITDVAGRLADLIAHRRHREAAILDALPDPAGADAMLDLESVMARAYPDLPPALRGAAARNTLAHLIDLEARKLVFATGLHSPAPRFRRL